MISSVVKPPLKAVFLCLFFAFAVFRHSVSSCTPYKRGISTLQSSERLKPCAYISPLAIRFHALKFPTFISRYFRNGNLVREFAGARKLRRISATAIFCKKGVENEPEADPSTGGRAVRARTLNRLTPDGGD